MKSELRDRIINVLKFYLAEVIDDKESEFVKMYVEYGTFYNMNDLELLKMFSLALSDPLEFDEIDKRTIIEAFNASADLLQRLDERVKNLRERFQVEPEFIEKEEPKVVKINNEKIPEYDSDSPVDHERIVAGILEMFKLSVQHNCEPEMEFGFQINDRILKAKVELEVE